mmetsp:Transcript_20626/g.47646  ORF Transcript_20626/g.47646 Transcript_20626/m.47646 type:complete len:218 (+) Transcript_20626:232-885(+)
MGDLNLGRLGALRDLAGRFLVCHTEVGLGELGTLGLEAGGGLVTLRLDELGASVALCLHLLLHCHCSCTVLQRLEVQKLDSEHLEAPLGELHGEASVQVVVDGLLSLQRCRHGLGAKHVLELSLGHVLDSRREVINLVHGSFNVSDAVVHDSVDAHLDSVHSVHVLGGEVKHRLAQVNAGESSRFVDHLPPVVHIRAHPNELLGRIEERDQAVDPRL